LREEVVRLLEFGPDRRLLGGDLVEVPVHFSSLSSICWSTANWSGSREEAEDVLRDVLTDEPGWAGELGVVPIEFAHSNQ